MFRTELYGLFDEQTNVFEDGILTSIIRNILNINDELSQENKNKTIFYIVFDGDIDPEWAENLNSVLDDNKL